MFRKEFKIINLVSELAGLVKDTCLKEKSC